MKIKFSFYLLLVLIHFSAFTQVAVRYEPRHKVALENEYVRLLDVRLPPKDTSLFHIHEIPSFFIPLSTTTIGIEVKGQAPQESKFTAGSTWYNDFANGPLVHKVWNSDTNVLHVVDLELLSPKNTILPAVDLPGLKIDFENEKLRVYKFEIVPNQHLILPPLKTPMLFISVSGPTLEINNANGYVPPGGRKINAGGFQWLDPPKKYVISNSATSAANAILILLK
ncbi:MAG TPA: hypothetical protein VGQ09_08355 [Chitinophagaceae bacterium]|nr:hypothetical protein [Chitinophagaceae bacterium]